MTLPEVVGTQEAAEILGVPVPRIARWRKNGKMPQTVAELAATPVWLREDVEAKRAGVTEFPDRDRIPFVGLSEVAGVFKVNKSQIGRWRRVADFPEPSVQLAAGPLWLKPDVKRFTPPAKRRARAA